ncbi:MAG: hypothetical protein RLZZ210_1257 [Pseudomonadota bacterium]|jgi:carbonic anhydrase
MTVVNISHEDGLTLQEKLQKIKVVQESMKSMQESISSDIKQRDGIVAIRVNSQVEGFQTNEYVPHPADSARDIKILDARISSKQQKITVMQQEIAKMLQTISMNEEVAA